MHESAIPMPAPALEPAREPLPADEECPVCGSSALAEVKCKTICRNCLTIVRSCADL